MKIRNLFIILFILSTILACVQTSKDVKMSKKLKIKTFQYVEGTIDAIDNKVVKIKATLPEYESSTLPFTNRITQKVLNKSILIKNLETSIGNYKVKILEKKDNLIEVKFEKTPLLKVGDIVRISNPRKTIAITDFEVIRGHDKSIGVISMESLTTAMVNTNQFNIVERRKIKTVLKELELGLTGLVNANKVQNLGNLLQADMVLTGTFANLGGYWNVNIRLINVSNGLIIAAFEDKANFSEIKPGSSREMSNINESFEKKAKPGWIIGAGSPTGTYRTVKIDKNIGANGTSSSIRMDFRFGNKPSFVGIKNLFKRDLSLYSGIEFYAKVDQPTVIIFDLIEVNPDDINKSDKYFYLLEIGNSWKKYKINFTDMSLSPSYPRKHPGGDGTLRLDLVRSIGFSAGTKNNPKNIKRTLWIDEINFY